MTKRIAIAGSGAVGSNVGALLTRAGHDVTLVEGWPEHVDAMREFGLQIEMQEETFRTAVKALHLYEVCTLSNKFDIVFLQCKSYDSRWMAELIKPYISPDGVLVSVQNSVNEDWLVPILGRERVLGCVLTISCELWDPGRAKRNSAFDEIAFTVGELSGVRSDRADQVAEILSAAGRSDVTTNLVGARWSKLVLNSMDMPIAALTRQTAREVVRDPDCMKACMVLGKESLSVALALGIDIEPIFGLTASDFRAEPDEVLNRLMVRLAERVRDARGAHWYDLVKGRRTEIDYLNGYVIDKGKQVGVPTPANAALTELIHGLERKDLESGRPNLRLLEPAYPDQIR